MCIQNKIFLPLTRISRYENIRENSIPTNKCFKIGFTWDNVFKIEFVQKSNTDTSEKKE